MNTNLKDTADLPTIAIISVGTMGIALATILVEEGYQVITNLEGRSAKTKARAESIGIRECSFVDLLREAAMILSIVPPTDAITTAKRVADAARANSESSGRCVYFDLNAISKARTLEVGELIRSAGLIYLDGGILGRPPVRGGDGLWTWFTVLISGSHLQDILDRKWVVGLNKTLNIRHVGDSIGAASGLKMCFGSFYKGQAAIMIQAYATAANLGCLSDLRGLLKEYSPSTSSTLEASVIDMQHKAYRWIKEMEDISETFNESGGWSKNLYTGVGEVYRVVDQKTELGREGKSSIEEIIDEVCNGLKS